MNRGNHLFVCPSMAGILPQLVRYATPNEKYMVSFSLFLSRTDASHLPAAGDN